MEKTRAHISIVRLTKTKSIVYLELKMEEIVGFWLHVLTFNTPKMCFFIIGFCKESLEASLLHDLIMVLLFPGELFPIQV